MQTPSHWVITAAIGKRWPQVWGLRGAALWGSLAPDIPLYLLTFGGILYYHVFLGWSLPDTRRHLFRYLFFEDPGWIIAHHTLHSPVSLVLLLVLTWRLQERFPKLCAWLFTFLISCGLHTLIDIPVHAEDGPLLLFPFEWTIRFHSPISYWDPRYYGDQFAWFEGGLVLGLVGYLLFGRRR